MRELVEEYVAAWERHDIEAIRRLLVEDAIFAMPPCADWRRGRDAIARLFAKAGPLRLRHVSLHANAQPAIAQYVLSGDRET